MAKKLSPKEIREAAKAEKMKSIKAAEAEREKAAEEAKLKAEAEKKEKAEKNEREKALKRFRLDEKSRMALPKSERKSLAKAAGVKSAFAVGNDIYLTSFDRGNDAIVEKKITDTVVTNLRSDESFEVNENTITEMSVPIKSKRISDLYAIADNPLYRKDSATKVQPDKLLLKDTLEKLYFGKTFDDTLHIQIIYNILDIEKILTVYSINTIYCLNNLFGKESGEKEDLISKLTYQITYDEFKESKAHNEFIDFYNLNTLGYYGNIFFKEKKKRSQKEIYDIIALIATIRQWCVHCEEDKRTWLFNTETVLSKEFLDILDDVYESLVEKVNRNFLKDNKVNLQILEDVLEIKDSESREKLIRQYYRFIVTKEQKLLGFSIKKLREAMLEETEFKTDKKYDTVRSKLYKLIDFLLFTGYTTDEAEKEKALFLIKSLRESLTEETKDRIYKSEAARLWLKYENTITNKIREALNEKSISELKKDKSFDDKSITSIITDEVSGKKATYFSKTIYLLAQFIDGKEVNDLTTSLINKFDNIRSLIDTAGQIGLDCKFTEEYKFFENSDQIRTELHVIKNLTNMEYYDTTVKKQMYKDAVHILGIQDDVSDAELEKIINSILLLNENGKPLPGTKGKKGFRNFIISNVLKSRRFIYLIKYCNPKKIRKIAGNRKIIKFVLSRITDSQLERYYYSCNPELKSGIYPGRDDAVNDLSILIADMKFEDFKNVDQSANVHDNNNAAREKMKYQTIISLYLTVCYHLVKNLVNINARYAMAFHALERDARLYQIFSSEENYVDNLNADYAILTKTLLKDNYENAGNLYLRNKKWNKLTRENLDNYIPQAAANFRNAVAHLNPIRNADMLLEDIEDVSSYYAIYHYIMQKSVTNRTIRVSNTTEDEKRILTDYQNKIKRHHGYNKDFVKALCVPFAYNIVRFKSLSIYEMFDRNYHEKTSPETDDSQSP